MAELKPHNRSVETFGGRKSLSKNNVKNDISQDQKKTKIESCSATAEEEESYSDDSQYSVEEIVDKRIMKGRVKYLVKWRGYEEPTWEKEENMNCLELLKEFENRRYLKGNDRKLKTKKQREPNVKSKVKLKNDSSNRGSITVPNRKEKLHTKHKDSREINSINTVKAKEAYGTSVTTEHNEMSESLTKSNSEEMNSVHANGRGSYHSVSNLKRRSLSHRINRWVKKDVSQKVTNASDGEIKILEKYCGSCGSPIGENALTVDKKSKRSTSSGCSEKKSVSEMRECAKSPLRLSASTSPLSGTPLGVARASKKLGIAERIIGAQLMGEEIMFLVKCQGSDLPDWIPSRIGNTKFPQLVIKYYEDRLMWNTSSTESTPR